MYYDLFLPAIIQTMKLIYFTLVLFLISCETRQGSEKAMNVPRETLNEQRRDFDTVVGIIKVPPELSVSNYSGRDYFLIMDGDTSDLTFTTTTNMESGDISGSFNFLRAYQNYNSENLADTNAINRNIIHQSHSKKMTSDQVLRELKLLLAYVAKDADMQKLTFLRFFIGDVPDFTAEVQKIFFNQYHRSINIRDSRALAGIIESSNFTKQLDEIFSDYSLSVDKVFFSDLVIIMRNDSALPSNQEGLNGPVVFTIKRRITSQELILQ